MNSNNNLGQDQFVAYCASQFNFQHSQSHQRESEQATTGQDLLFGCPPTPNHLINSMNTTNTNNTNNNSTNCTANNRQQMMMVQLHDANAYLEAVQTATTSTGQPIIYRQLLDLLQQAPQLSAETMASRVVDLLRDYPLLCVGFNLFLKNCTILHFVDSITGENCYQILSANSHQTHPLPPGSSNNNYNNNTNNNNDCSSTNDNNENTISSLDNDSSSNDIGNGQSSALTLEQAKLYLNQVRYRVTMAGQPKLYDQFKTYIGDYLAGRKTAQTVTKQVKILFRYYPDLLVEFSRLIQLPAESSGDEYGDGSEDTTVVSSTALRGGECATVDQCGSLGFTPFPEESGTQPLPSIKQLISSSTTTTNTAPLTDGEGGGVCVVSADSLDNKPLR